MLSFEVLTYKDGKWRIDSIFDDRELAVFEAGRLAKTKRYAGVKVVQETWDESTITTKIRTVFRGGAARSDLPANISPEDYEQQSTGSF